MYTFGKDLLEEHDNIFIILNSCKGLKKNLSKESKREIQRTSFYLFCKLLVPQTWWIYHENFPISKIVWIIHIGYRMWSFVCRCFHTQAGNPLHISPCIHKLLLFFSQHIPDPQHKRCYHKLPFLRKWMENQSEILKMKPYLDHLALDWSWGSKCSKTKDTSPWILFGLWKYQ